MKPAKASWFFWAAARVFVGLIFAYAGFAKLLEPAANFEATLLKYGVFPPGWIPLVARTVPWAEWILGSFLVVGYAPRWSAVTSSLLSLSFLVTLGSSRLFLESGGADCGCFGQGGLRLNLRQIFVVDLASLVILIRIALFRSHPWTLDAFLLKRTGQGDDT